MKKITALISVLLVAMLTVFSVAAKSGRDILAEHNEDYAEECENVILAVKANYTEYSAHIGESLNDIDFELMYRCYELESDDFIKAFREDGNFKDNISTSYYWVVPSYDTKINEVNGQSGEVVVCENNELEFGWAIREGISYPSYGDLDTDYASLCDIILDEHPDADSDDIRVVYGDMIKCRMFYFTEDGEEYILPMFLNEDPKWADSGKIYTAEEFIENASQRVSSSSQNDDGFFKSMRNNIDYIIGAGVIVLVCVIVFVILYKKKNSKNEDE